MTWKAGELPALHPALKKQLFRPHQDETVPAITITFLGTHPAGASTAADMLQVGLCPFTAVAQLLGRRRRMVWDNTDRVAAGTFAAAKPMNARAGAHKRISGAAMKIRGKGFDHVHGIDDLRRVS